MRSRSGPNRFSTGHTRVRFEPARVRLSGEMTDSNVRDLLGRVVEAGGVLLRVECLHPVGTNAAALVLTFDVGRLLLSVHPDAPGLTTLALENPDDVPGGLEDASENEPWWRGLGNALGGVEAGGTDGAAIRLQFRLTDQNPRFITIAALGTVVGIELERV